MDEDEDGRKEALAYTRFFTEVHNAFISQMTQGNLRMGQAWMNALHTVDPEFHQQIVGTDVDCYYNDYRIPDFKEAVFTERIKKYAS